MVVAVVLMASAVRVGGKGLHADWWVNPLLQYAHAQSHNWYRLIFGNIKNCHKCQTNLKNLKRKLHLFRVMDTKPSSTDCSVGARSWAREASTVILCLVQSRTNYNSVKLCKKTLHFRQILFLVCIHIEHRLKYRKHYKMPKYSFSKEIKITLQRVNLTVCNYAFWR